jgi:hypothetical protein
MAAQRRLYQVVGVNLRRSNRNPFFRLAVVISFTLRLPDRRVVDRRRLCGQARAKNRRHSPTRHSRAAARSSPSDAHQTGQGLCLRPRARSKAARPSITRPCAAPGSPMQSAGCSTWNFSRNLSARADLGNAPLFGPKALPIQSRIDALDAVRWALHRNGVE